jgi:ribonuclease BN (tRNA processing enzyme)
MRITVFGGCGVWPAAGQACGGYLVEHDGFRLLVDPGYATLPRLLEQVDAGDIDATLISHGHPDHCADLHPLLRARAFGDGPAPMLPVFALPGAADPVLALGGRGTLENAYQVHEFAAGDRFEIGPFRVDTRSLPHFVPNAGLRLAAGGRVLAYTGDTGPSPERRAQWTHRQCRPGVLSTDEPPHDQSPVIPKNAISSGASSRYRTT